MDKFVHAFHIKTLGQIHKHFKAGAKKFVLHDPKQRRCGDAKKTKRGGLCVNEEKSKSCWTTTQQRADI